MNLRTARITKERAKKHRDWLTMQRDRWIVTCCYEALSHSAWESDSNGHNAEQTGVACHRTADRVILTLWAGTMTGGPVKKNSPNMLRQES